jgi:hypothetical protein
MVHSRMSTIPWFHFNLTAGKDEGVTTAPLYKVDGCPARCLAGPRPFCKLAQDITPHSESEAYQDAVSLTHLQLHTTARNTN